jgi:hypothetical protein
VLSVMEGSKLTGVGVVLWLSWGCASGTPAVSPAPVVPPAPPPALVAAPFNAEACQASLELGPAVGVWVAGLGHGNTLTLNVHLPKGTEVPEGELPEIGPGAKVVAWGELIVPNVEELLDFDDVKGVADPGSICVTSETIMGVATHGEISQEGRFQHAVQLTLVGLVDDKIAEAFWAHEDVVEAAEARKVPGYDRQEAGRSYVLARFGTTGPQAYVAGLEHDQRIRGDVVISMVDGTGSAIYEPITAR